VTDTLWQALELWVVLDGGGIKQVWLSCNIYWLTVRKIGPVQMFAYFYIRDDKGTFEGHWRKKFNKVHIIKFTGIYMKYIFERSI